VWRRICDVYVTQTKCHLYKQRSALWTLYAISGFSGRRVSFISDIVRRATSAEVDLSLGPTGDLYRSSDAGVDVTTEQRMAPTNFLPKSETTGTRFDDTDVALWKLSSNFLARDVIYIHLALMLRCQCPSVCGGSALGRGACREHSGCASQRS